MDLSQILRNEPLSRVGFRRLVAVGPRDTLARAVALMQAEHVGSVLVCEGERLLGMLTERNVLTALAAGGATLDEPVESRMVRTPACVRRDESMAAAICKMHRDGHRRLPVVDERGRPLGILAMKRIVRYLAEHFPRAVYTLPPRPGHYAVERDGA